MFQSNVHILLFLTSFHFPYSLRSQLPYLIVTSMVMNIWIYVCWKLQIFDLEIVQLPLKSECDVPCRADFTSVALFNIVNHNTEHFHTCLYDHDYNNLLLVVFLKVTSQKFDSWPNVSAAGCCLLQWQWLTECVVVNYVRVTADDVMANDVTVIDEWN